MGKRELLLAAVFIVLGVAVYQVSAPPADPSKRRWSFSGIVDEIRREVRGRSARAEVITTNTIPVSANVREIRILRFPVEVAVIGEDRADIAYELKVNSRAYDDAEAQQTAKATSLKVDPAGEVLNLAMDYPRGGQQSATLKLRVPKRLALRVDEKGGGKLVVTDVAGVTLGLARGETSLTNVSGPVTVTQRGSVIAITNVGPLKLTTTSAEARVNGVHGNATLMFQGGEVRGEGFEGSIEMEIRLNTEVKLERLEKATGPIRVNANGGELFLSGLAADTRIDARRTEVRVEQAAPAPLAIYSDGEEPIEVAAAGSFAVDAVASGGRVTLDDALQKAGLTVATAKAGEADRLESRVTGPVRGGGPTITLRATRGDISLRSRN